MILFCTVTLCVVGQELLASHSSVSGTSSLLISSFFFTARRYFSATYAAVMCLYVCVSVCLSHTGIVSKRLKLGSGKQHPGTTVFQFFDAEDLGDIRTNSPPLSRGPSALAEILVSSIWHQKP